MQISLNYNDLTEGEYICFNIDTDLEDSNLSNNTISLYALRTEKLKDSNQTNKYKSILETAKGL